MTHSPNDTPTVLLFTAEAHALALYKVEERARHFARESRADWADFSARCATHHRTALPALPETVVLYLSDRAETHKTATLQRRLTAIAQAYKAADLETPTTDRAVRRVMTGIRREKGSGHHARDPRHGRTSAHHALRSARPSPVTAGLCGGLPPQ